MAEVTIFQNINDTRTPHHRHILKILDRIKSGKSQKQVMDIRLEADKDKRNQLKGKLPSVCFSGTFRERNNASLIKHSGFICLDFDNQLIKGELEEDENIFAAWESPSGTGVKALVRIPTDNHRGSFLALQKKYPTMDTACKDVARVCYESWDPNLYLNQEAKVFKEQIEETWTEVSVDKPETDSTKIYEKLKVWLERKGERFSEGNRNNFLCKLLGACNRFGISRQDARSFVLYDFVNGASGFALGELETVLKSVYGNYRSQHGTCQFESSEIVVKDTREVISESVIDFSLPPKDIIFLNDVREDMLYDFEHGPAKGETTHMFETDSIFRWAKGELTCMYGIGNHGKTAMAAYLMLQKCVMDDWVWVIFSPEQYPPKWFYTEWVQMFIGRPSKGPNKMSLAEFKEGMDFIHDHILYLFPENNDPTAEYVNERFIEAISKRRVDGVMVDPWNQLYHPMHGMREDQYLSEQFRNCKNLATKEGIVYLVIAHCNSSAANLGKAPYFTRDLAGGAMWGNKFDNILLYYRPNYEDNPKDNLCQLTSQKIKRQQLNGRPGTVDMIYDLNRFCFEELDDNGNPRTNRLVEQRKEEFEDELPF